VPRKLILKGVLFLIAASTFLAYLILSSYHFNELKPRISRAFWDLTGRELTLSGNIQLKIGYRPALTVEDAHLENVSWGSRPELVKINRLELQVALLPLLRGDIDIRRFILVEPDILLERDNSGRWNIGLKGEKGKAAAEVKKAGMAEEWELPLFALNQLQIKRGRLIYKDGQSGKTYSVTLESASAAAAHSDSPVAIMVKGAYGGRSFQVKGTLGPLASLADPDKAWPLNLVAKTGRATVSAEGVIKDVANAKGFSFIVKTEGQSTTDITDLINITQVPELRPFKVTGKVSDLNGKLTIENLDAHMGNEALAKVDVVGVIKDPRAKRGIDLKVAIKGKNLTSLEKLLGKRLHLKGPFHGMGRLTETDGRLMVQNFQAQVGHSKLARLKLSGTVNDILAQRDFDLKFHVQGKNLANLEKLLGLSIPLKGPFKASGRVNDLGHKTYKFSDFKGTLRNSDLSGSVDIRLDSKRPRLTAVLSSRKLDLRPFLSKKKRRSRGAKGSVKGAAKKKAFSSDPLTLDTLKRADAEIMIKAKRFLIPRLPLRDLSAQIFLKSGRLRVREVRSIMGGGTLKGRLDLRLRRKGAIVATALRIDHADLGRMLKDLKVTDILEGKVDVDVNIRAHGRSVAALMAALNGKITLVMENGRMNNTYIDMLGADVGSSLGKLLDSSSGQDYTELNCFVCRFDIKQGLADNTVLVLDTKATSLIGDGEIDLKTEKLNLTMRSYPKRGVGISGVGKLSLSIGEFAKPLKLGGTLRNPAFVMDPSQTIITMGKAFGGMLLFGPLGLGAALVSGRLGSDNPCPAAIEVAKKGPKRPGAKKQGAESSIMMNPEEDEEDFF
jgi:uncharacterized protein involved in outer membrane biogenesis